MNESQDKKEALNKLYECRENIEKYLAEIETIISVNFTDKYAIAYQHWIPQIKTALRNNTKWLSRGEYSMDDLIVNIEDNMKENIHNKGVSKYIN
jgi:hypothetical protein